MPSTKTTFVLTIDGKKRAVPTLAKLRAALKSASAASELWLNCSDGPALSMLANGDRAWLMFLPEPGEAGFSSRGDDAIAKGKTTLDFRLSNGQVDRYPIAWTMPRAHACKALEHFFEKGERAPFVKWHAD